MKEHEIEVIEEAFSRHLKRCSFFPTPAEIVSNCAVVEMLTYTVEGDYSAVGTIASSERVSIGTHNVIAVTMESGDEFFFEPTYDSSSKTTARKLSVGATVEVRYGIRHCPRGFDPPPAGKIIQQCRSMEVGDPKEWWGFIRYTRDWKDALNVRCTTMLLRAPIDCLCVNPDLSATLTRAYQTGGFVRFVYQRQDLGDAWANVVTSIISMEPLAQVTGQVQKTTIGISPQGRQQVVVEMEDGRTLVSREDVFEEWEQLQDTEGWTIKVSVAGELIVDIVQLEDNGLTGAIGENESSALSSPESHLFGHFKVGQ